MGNNLFIGNNLVTAKATISFADAAITSDNCRVVYENHGVAGFKSYVPGRAVNPISGFTIDKQYIVNMKTAADLSAIVTKPFGVKFPVSLSNIKIVGDGNSYMVGTPSYTPALTTLLTLTPFNTNGAAVSNFGVSGQNTGMMLTDQATQVLPAFSAGRLNVLIVEEGGNDVGFSGSVVDSVARMKLYCNNARSYCSLNNIPLFVILSTKIPRDQDVGEGKPAFNAKLVEYNSQTLAESSYYDYIIRPDLESIFATYSAGGYDPDKIHPNETGQAKYAAMYKAAILALTSI